MKKTLFQVLGLCVFSNFRYSSKWFAQIYKAVRELDIEPPCWCTSVIHSFFIYENV